MSKDINKDLDKLIKKKKNKNNIFLNILLVITLFIGLFYFIINIDNNINNFINNFILILFTITFVIIGFRSNIKKSGIIVLSSLLLIGFYGYNLFNKNTNNVSNDKVINLSGKKIDKVIDWANYEHDDDHPVLLTTVPPITYSLPQEIATLLRKGNAEDSPIAKKLNHISNNLKKKISEKGETEQKYEPADNEDKDSLFIKLIHQMRKLQHNERNIRRYRNQDMLLFDMAKRILLSGGVVIKDNGQVERGVDQFKLQDILPPAMRKGSDKDLLEQKVEFRLTINLNDENGKPIMDSEGKPLKRTISQTEIKIKNYGDFYTFLYDSRIGTLLSQLTEIGDIKRDNLETEFDHYDRQRQEVFRLLQEIERLIIKSHPAIANNNAGKPEFYDKDGKPYRNSFSSLLSLCKQYLNEDGNPSDVSILLTEIRNAFSHNRYVKSQNKLLDIRTLSLPEVADHILNWLKKHQHNNE